MRGRGTKEEVPSSPKIGGSAFVPRPRDFGATSGNRRSLKKMPACPLINFFVLRQVRQGGEDKAC